jgi:hypothetical protein
LKDDPDSLLLTFLNEGMLTLPQDRRFRKEVFRKVTPAAGLELTVSISSRSRLPPPGTDWEFLEYLLQRSDSKEEYVPLGALLEFQLKHGIRELLSLRERIQRCSLYLRCRYRTADRLAVGNYCTIFNHRLTEEDAPPKEDDFDEFFNEYFGIPSRYENVGNKKGVWINRDTVRALLEAQEFSNTTGPRKRPRTETSTKPSALKMPR